MQGAKTHEEFDPRRPAASAAAVLRAIFFSPRRFYLGFPADGPLREPTLFVLFVSAISGVLSVLLNLVLQTDTIVLGVLALNLLFVLLSPALVALAVAA